MFYNSKIFHHSDESIFVECSLSYNKFIIKMMENGNNWLTYDTLFRKARDTTPYLWTEILMDSRFDIDQKPSKKQTPPQQKRQFFRNQFSKVQPGYCYSFHKKISSCTDRNCSYDHRCQICHGSHPLYRHRDSQNNYSQRNNYQDRYYENLKDALKKENQSPSVL